MMSASNNLRLKSRKAVIEMNPELIERPSEIEHYHQLRSKERQESITICVIFTLLIVGFLSGWFWRTVFEWLF